MVRIKCTLAYDGSQFFGYQIQPNKRTVQGEIEKALEKLHKGVKIPIVASGRTDAGVHAKGQVIHFDSFLSIPCEKWPVVLNSLFPDDISVTSAQFVSPTFHARFDVVGKEYRYFVYRSRVRDPFKRYYAYQYCYLIDIEAMKKAATYLTGLHDFTSFCSAKTEIENRIREIKEIEIIEEEDMLVFRFVGNGFLYNMVRIMVGTLLDVGRGQLRPDDIPIILSKKDRTFAGKTAPPQGLYLWEVYYENHSLNDT